MALNIIKFKVFKDLQSVWERNKPIYKKNFNTLFGGGAKRVYNDWKTVILHQKIKHHVKSTF